MPLTEQEKILSVRLPIGEWNMDTLASIAINHGLDYQKIDNVSVIIRNDSDAFKYKFDAFIAGGAGIQAIAITPTQIILERFTGGFFDNINFNSTAINRGFISIKYFP